MVCGEMTSRVISDPMSCVNIHIFLFQDESNQLQNSSDGNNLGQTEVEGSRKDDESSQEEDDVDEGDFREDLFRRKQELSTLTVKELKKLCETLKVAQYGAKEVIISRILDAEEGQRDVAEEANAAGAGDRSQRLSWT
jgi:hypothetical protein